MMRANIVWDEANLRAYLADPQAKVRGNRMPFGGLSDPQDIADVIAFLKATSSGGPCNGSLGRQVAAGVAWRGTVGATTLRAAGRTSLSPAIEMPPQIV